VQKSFGKKGAMKKIVYIISLFLYSIFKFLSLLLTINIFKRFIFSINNLFSFCN